MSRSLGANRKPGKVEAEHVVGGSAGVGVVLGGLQAGLVVEQSLQHMRCLWRAARPDEITDSAHDRVITVPFWGVRT